MRDEIDDDDKLNYSHVWNSSCKKGWVKAGQININSCGVSYNVDSYTFLCVLSFHESKFTKEQTAMNPSPGERPMIDLYLCRTIVTPLVPAPVIKKGLLNPVPHLFFPISFYIIFHQRASGGFYTKPHLPAMISIGEWRSVILSE